MVYYHGTSCRKCLGLKDWSKFLDRFWITTWKLEIFLKQYSLIYYKKLRFVILAISWKELQFNIFDNAWPVRTVFCLNCPSWKRFWILKISSSNILFVRFCGTVVYGPISKLFLAYPTASHDGSPILTKYPSANK